MIFLVSVGFVAGQEALGGEVYFHDRRREMAMVDLVTPEGKLRLLSASGESRDVAVEDLVYVQFWGRKPRSIHSGTQEVVLVNRDRVRGQIMKLENDVLRLDSFAMGEIDIPLDNVHGLLTLPVQGAAGRRAEELLEDQVTDTTGLLDQFLDRRSAYYDGVVEDLNPGTCEIDDEQLMRTTSLKILYLAGIRLAESTKKPRPPLPGEVFMRIITQDGGAIDGMLRKIEFGMWKIQPIWDPRKLIPVRIDEIVYVSILNGRTLFLSQLDPTDAKEKTNLAPNQPYRHNRNCKGDVISLAGNHYAWGVGVHADSTLTYEIGGRFKEFKATVGIDDKVGEQGSVIFEVEGDGKSLVKTAVIRRAEAPQEISVPVAGVQKLTLKVTDAGDLDLGDCANWANARLVR